MSNSWFRLYHEFATDPKIQMLSEANQRRYIMILCLRCSNGDVTLHDDEVAFQLRISNDDWINTKEVLISKNLIDERNNPVAWDKRQFTSDSSRERVSRYRAKKKNECNVTVTPPDTDTDTDTDKRKNIKKENPDFNLFWESYPKKTGKQDALKIWNKKKPPISDVLKALQWQKVSQQWLEGYIPNPSTYLNQGRWEDEPQQEFKRPNARGSPGALSVSDANKQRTEEARKMLFGQLEREEKDVTNEAKAL